MATNDLTVRTVIDQRGKGSQLIDAEAWLLSLSELGYSQLREATAQQTLDHRLIVCAECEWPVYSPDDPHRRPYFQHKKGYPKDCYFSGGEGRDPRQVDAEKFNGIQEGERHKSLKSMLAKILQHSTHILDVSIERYTRLLDGTFARPDVYAGTWLQAPLAFDIQLSTTQIPTIVRREAFYKRGNIRYAWITDISGERLFLRAFKDIYMRNDGQIFGVGEDALRQSIENGEAMLGVHRLTPGPPETGFKPVFESSIHSIQEIEWGDPGDRPRLRCPNYDQRLDLNCQNSGLSDIRQTFYNALREDNLEKAREVWDGLQLRLGGMTWDALPCSPYDAVRSLGVLATVRTGERYVDTSLGPDELAALANSMLLEPNGRRVFGELFEQIVTALNKSNLLEVPSIASKLDRAKRETLQVALARNIGATFDALFPEGAFQRLTLQ